MYLTIRAERFSIHEGTPVAALPGIFCELSTFGTQAAFWGSMLLLAIQRDHFADHALFPFPFGLYVFHDHNT